MKASAKLNYGVEDVFKVFIKAAKQEFKEFDKEDPKGLKIVKNISSAGSKPMKCTVEITDYEENAKYEITTSNSISKCKSTYKFKEQRDGNTLVKFEESQGGNGLVSSMTLVILRFMAKRKFKKRFKAMMAEIENEIRRQKENLERSKKKA